VVADDERGVVGKGSRDYSRSDVMTPRLIRFGR
jgi:hypothetical protein